MLTVCDYQFVQLLNKKLQLKQYTYVIKTIVPLGYKTKHLDQNVVNDTKNYTLKPKAHFVEKPKIVESQKLGHEIIITLFKKLAECLEYSECL